MFRDIFYKVTNFITMAIEVLVSQMAIKFPTLFLAKINWQPLNSSFEGGLVTIYILIRHVQSKPIPAVLNSSLPVFLWGNTGQKSFMDMPGNVPGAGGDIFSASVKWIVFGISPSHNDRASPVSALQADKWMSDNSWFFRKYHLFQCYGLAAWRTCIPFSAKQD